MTTIATDNTAPIYLPHALMTAVRSYATPLSSADRQAYLAAVYEQLRTVPAERLGPGQHSVGAAAYGYDRNQLELALRCQSPNNPSPVRSMAR
jgi:hypothetical protein